MKLHLPDLSMREAYERRLRHWRHLATEIGLTPLPQAGSRLNPVFSVPQRQNGKESLQQEHFVLK